VKKSFPNFWVVEKSLPNFRITKIHTSYRDTLTSFFS
jgi:hypothetical protein